MAVAFVFAVLINFGACRFGGRIALAMHRAQPLAEEEAPEVFEIVKELSAKAGIPAPRLFMLPSASANAFAAGRSPRHSAIALTHGIVGLLNKEELSGVLGHELSHILNRDILLSSIVAVFAGACAAIASAFCWSFSWGGERDEHDRGHPLASILNSAAMAMAAIFIRLFVSRSGEYGADGLGARLCGNPLYLASALRKIERTSQRLPLRDAAPATAHLFIMDPLSRKGRAAFFSTHPPMEDRLARLERMTGPAL